MNHRTDDTPAATGATPETDAAIVHYMDGGDWEAVPVDFARQLERERDDARRELAELKELYNVTKNLIPELSRELAEANEEREFTQKELNYFREKAEAQPPSAAASSTGAPVAWMLAEGQDNLTGKPQFFTTKPVIEAMKEGGYDSLIPLYAAPQSAVGAPAGWYCGCGHTNGFNLAVCACCGRNPNGEHP